MNKDFDDWNELKKKYESHNNHIFEENEIWWASIGVNIGFESCGKNSNFNRPVLILKKFNKFIFLGIPLSSKIKQGKYYYNFEFKGKNSNALLSQVRLFDSKRITHLIGKLSDKQVKLIKEKLCEVIMK